VIAEFTKELNEHIDFTYSSFDRVLFRGYITSLFFDGQVVSLLRNMGFKDHSNGVLKLLTDQLNSHIKKEAERLNINIHWWGTAEKEKYHSKIDLVEAQYSNQLKTINKKSKVIYFPPSLGQQLCNCKIYFNNHCCPVNKYRPKGQFLAFNSID
jgi:hypothetical protein